MACGYHFITSSTSAFLTVGFLISSPHLAKKKKQGFVLTGIKLLMNVSFSHFECWIKCSFTLYRGTNLTQLVSVYRNRGNNSSRPTLPPWKRSVKIFLCKCCTCCTCCTCSYRKKYKVYKNDFRSLHLQYFSILKLSTHMYIQCECVELSEQFLSYETYDIPQESSGLFDGDDRSCYLSLLFNLIW